MNKSLIYLLSLPLFALLACSDEGSFGTEQQQPSSRQALTLSVCANDFATYSDGALNTRATHSGTTTTFANGDRVGVIILDAADNLLADNIPYTYNGSSWAFDTANGEGKTPCYYDNKAATYTYIVYYPYSSEANGITTTDALKTKFSPLFDQSTEENYSASDLLLWEHTHSPLKSLDVQLTHAYASVSFMRKVQYTLDDGESTIVDVFSSISDVSFTIGNDTFVAHKATTENSSYCCIFPASGSDVAIRYVYTYLGETFKGTLSAASGAIANTRHTSTVTDSRTYTFADVQLGDFYCKDASDNAYLIPSDVVTLTDTQKTACLGIVLKGGKDDSGKWKDDCVYTQKDGTTPMPTIHGYVLALYDANHQSCVWGLTVNTGTDLDRSFYGYTNTNTIKAYAENNSKNLQTDFPATYHAAEGYEAKYPAPDNSSGWFLPSSYQCQYWKDNKDAILAGVRKATLSPSYNWRDLYWTSTENRNDQAGNAMHLSFPRGGIVFYYKRLDCYVRSVFAF